MEKPQQEGYAFYPFISKKNGKVYYKKYKLKGKGKKSSGRPKLKKTICKELINKLDEEKCELILDFINNI